MNDKDIPNKTNELINLAPITEENSILKDQSNPYPISVNDSNINNSQSINSNGINEEKEFKQSNILLEIKNDKDDKVVDYKTDTQLNDVDRKAITNVLMMSQQIFGKECPNYLILQHTGEILDGKGNLNLAIQLFKQSVYEFKQLIKNGDINAAKDYFFPVEIHVKLGETYTRGKMFVDAVKAYKTALRLSKGYYDNKSKNYATILDNLSFAHQMNGQLAEAIEICEELQPIYISLYGDNSELYASFLYHFANLYNEKCLFDKAFPLVEQSLGIYEKLFPKKDSEEMVNCYVLIGCVISSPQFRQFHKAEQYVRKGFQMALRLVSNKKMDSGQVVPIHQTLERMHQLVVNPPPLPQLCCVCHQPSKFNCSRCKNRLYCSSICQKKDWKKHKSHCKK